MEIKILVIKLSLLLQIQTYVINTQGPPLRVNAWLIISTYPLGFTLVLARALFKTNADLSPSCILWDDFPGCVHLGIQNYGQQLHLQHASTSRMDMPRKKKRVIQKSDRDYLIHLWISST